MVYILNNFIQEKFPNILWCRHLRRWHVRASHMQNHFRFRHFLSSQKLFNIAEDFFAPVMYFFAFFLQRFVHCIIKIDEVHITKAVQRVSTIVHWGRYEELKTIDHISKLFSFYIIWLSLHAMTILFVQCIRLSIHRLLSLSCDLWRGIEMIYWAISTFFGNPKACSEKRPKLFQHV